MLSTLRIISQRDTNRVEIAKEQLIKVRRSIKKIQERNKTLEEQIDENAEKLVGAFGLDAVAAEERLRQAEQRIRSEEKRIHEIEQKIEGIAETDDVEIDDAETDDAEIDDVETDENGITADERLRKNLTNFVSENFPNDDTPEEDSSQKTAQDLSRLYENKDK